MYTQCTHSDENLAVCLVLRPVHTVYDCSDVRFSSRRLLALPSSPPPRQNSRYIYAVLFTTPGEQTTPSRILQRFLVQVSPVLFVYTEQANTLYHPAPALGLW